MPDEKWSLVMECIDFAITKACDGKPQVTYRGDLIEITFDGELYILPTWRIRRISLTKAEYQP
jgi:hypothetical protein